MLKTQIVSMLNLQNEINRKVNKEWMTAGYEWNRAAWVECAELMDHIGWKWWKKQEPDIKQVKLELVDIWHFLLSWALVKKLVPEETIEEALKVKFEYHKRHSAKVITEMLAASCLAGDVFTSLIHFKGLCLKIGLSEKDLYTLYVGKNILNKFRQDNGYKEGTYKKVWFGREDNEHLYEIIETLDSESPKFKSELYAKLVSAYHE